MPAPDPTAATSVRLDVWLWSVRLFPTRSAAAAAIKAGHVRVNGERPKPATPVKLEDQILVRGERPRDVVVRTLLGRRVGAPIAVTAYLDRSPEPLPRGVFAVPQRERGAGRPTKRERREITELRGY